MQTISTSTATTTAATMIPIIAKVLTGDELESAADDTGAADEGFRVGAADGQTEGLTGLGLVGLKLGERVEAVGTIVGFVVGVNVTIVGTGVGRRVGLEGKFVGAMVGKVVGSELGLVGTDDGEFVTELVGRTQKLAMQLAAGLQH